MFVASEATNANNLALEGVILMYAVQKVFGEDWNNLSFSEQVAAIAYFDLGSEDKECIENFLRSGDFQLYDRWYSKESAIREYLEEMGVSEADLSDDSFDIEAFADDWNVKAYEIEYDNCDYGVSFSGHVVLTL